MLRRILNQRNLISLIRRHKIELKMPGSIPGENVTPFDIRDRNRAVNMDTPIILDERISRDEIEVRVLNLLNEFKQVKNIYNYSRLIILTHLVKYKHYFFEF